LSGIGHNAASGASVDLAQGPCLRRADARATAFPIGRAQQAGPLRGPLHLERAALGAGYPHLVVPSRVVAPTNGAGDVRARSCALGRDRGRGHRAEPYPDARRTAVL